MKGNAGGKFSNYLRLTAMVILAFGIAAGPVLYAAPKPKDKMAGKSGGKIILVTPAQLPELARQSGEAMLLHATQDGRTILYVEQNGGGRLAIFDVTDPSSIKRERSVQIDAAGPFDFVSSMNDSEVLVRFRQGQGDAALDLSKIWAPAIRTVPGLKLAGRTEKLGDDGLMVTSQTQASAADYQIVETANSRGAGQVFDVKDVREELTNNETGTTFLLTGDGLYLVRRPEVEEESKLHENQMNQPG
jgi:hypothetical protein